MSDTRMMNATDRLEQLYAQVPEVNCKGLCGESYCGPIGMGETERLRILDRIGHPPFSTIFPHIGEPDSLAFLESLAIRAGIVGCMKCPMLTDDGECKIYDIRPMICRIWGASEALRCPHGCRPKKLLTGPQGRALLTLSTKL